MYTAVTDTFSSSSRVGAHNHTKKNFQIAYKTLLINTSIIALIQPI